jgi:cation:H+ antiporter
MENTGAAAPWLFTALFLASSILMIWRLEAMNSGGLEGTVLGTLIMPYCSGIGNLLVAFVVGRNHGPGSDVMLNAIVNNVTNLTILLGLPAMIWGMRVMPAAKPNAKKKKNASRVHEINRLSLLLTLTAVLFFTGTVWALGRDGKLDFNDGLVLVGLFLFWQCFHVFEVLKSNAQKNKPFGWMLPANFAILIVGAYAQYVSIDWLNGWLVHSHGAVLNKDNFGWLSGLLTAVPNGLLALYYGWRGNPEVVYSSQVGDGHICIPLCVGIFALFQPFALPPIFVTGMYLLVGATLLHMFFVGLFGGLPRWMGWVLTAAYGVFVYFGMLR